MRRRRRTSRRTRPTPCRSSSPTPRPCSTRSASWSQSMLRYKIMWPSTESDLRCIHCPRVGSRLSGPVSFCLSEVPICNLRQSSDTATTAMFLLVSHFREPPHACFPPSLCSPVTACSIFYSSLLTLQSETNSEEFSSNTTSMLSMMSRVCQRMLDTEELRQR